MKTIMLAFLSLLAFGCSQEPVPNPPKNVFVTNQKPIASYVTLVETNLADGVRCVVVYSHGPSPGTAVACDWRGK